MSQEIELVINPKSLERQIKILDERLSELRSEMGALEKKREACATLLGNESAPVGASAEPPTAKKGSPRKKRETDRSSEETELSASDAEGAPSHSENVGALDAALSPVSDAQNAPASY